ncbi:MAG: C4-dicarboxylate ABC transporter [Halieaceae bacterium]|nr:C4-dicarboxylate ABC transporter [Halieaceae bacterium]
MHEPNWMSVLPPLLAIILAILTRQVVISLGMGIWAGFCILESVNPVAGVALAIEGVIQVFSDAGNTRVLVFTLVIGGLITTMEKVGGVGGFVQLLRQRAWVNSPAKAQWLAYLVGVVVFVESNITLLVAGSISRPLFDRYRISREKLAYIIDSTSAPICILIPLNSWGAFVAGLLAAASVSNPVGVFLSSIPLNFYPITVIVFSAVVIWRKLDIGPMRRAEQRTQAGQILWPNAKPMFDPPQLSMTQADTRDKARFMLAPIVMMVIAMPLGLFITGGGEMAKGSGSTAVLWAVLLALLTNWVLVLLHRRAGLDELMQTFLKGAGDFLPVAMILLFALALGDIANLLGTGIYVAQLAQESVPVYWLLPLLFLLSGFIAFSMGTSWGTFAIMIPLAVQLAVALDVSAPVFLAAVLSGAVFGDHASPISDTTVVASMASATDHIDHVRTQLPYALICAGIAALAFLFAGLLIL